MRWWGFAILAAGTLEMACTNFDGFILPAGESHDAMAADAKTNEAGTAVDTGVGDAPSADTGFDGGDDASDGSTDGTSSDDTSAPDSGGDATDAMTTCTEACSASSPCSPATSMCESVSCIASCCVTKNLSKETACGASQVCDGDGGCVECVVPGDCPDNGTKCTKNTCTDNACGTESAAVNTACSDNNGHVCNGLGACVQCTASDLSACTGLQSCSAAGQCTGL